MPNETPRQAAGRIADRYAIGSSQTELQYEIEAALNLAVANVTGVPPGPIDPPGPIPDRVA